METYPTYLYRAAKDFKALKEEYREEIMRSFENVVCHDKDDSPVVQDPLLRRMVLILTTLMAFGVSADQAARTTGMLLSPDRKQEE